MSSGTVTSPFGILSVREIVSSLCGTAPNVDELLNSPPDVFALVAAILRQRSAYVQIVNNRELVDDEWRRQVTRAGNSWRRRFATEESSSDRDAIKRALDAVVGCAEPAHDLWRSGNETFKNLVFLLAVADEACTGIGISAMCLETSPNGDCSKPQVEVASQLSREWFTAADRLNSTEAAIFGSSLGHSIHASRAVILPKLHTPPNGITLRTLTHNLAFWDNGEATGHWFFSPLNLPDYGLNLLILPWPITIPTYAFRPCKNSSSHFHYSVPSKYHSIRATSTGTLVADAIDQAKKVVGSIHGVILPELSLTPHGFEDIYEQLSAPALLVAGVGDRAFNAVWSCLKINGATKGRYPGFWSQAKHHRWRLTPSQMNAYGLGGLLDNDRPSWENIILDKRKVGFFQVNSWLTYCTLVCEDLARQDPLARLVRSVGPNLVITLLSDGPQLPNRWSSRYATVLADDPGSSVLTVTSAGMVDLNLEQYGRGNRSVGLWKDPLTDGSRELVLEKDAAGLVLSLARINQEEYSADDRPEVFRSGYLKLTGVHQVRMASIPEAAFGAPQPTEDCCPPRSNAAQALEAKINEFSMCSASILSRYAVDALRGKLTKESVGADMIQLGVDSIELWAQAQLKEAKDNAAVLASRERAIKEIRGTGCL